MAQSTAIRPYQEEIKAALEKGENEAAEALARAAFADASCDEELLALIGAMLYENGINSAFDLFEIFVNRYPDSLHLPRVYLSDNLARFELMDQATEEARIYLRKAKDQGIFQNLQSSKMIHEGISQAILLLTVGYTFLGARSYSKRALEYGKKIGLAPRWTDIVEDELSRLSEDLDNGDYKKRNEKWEMFFANGENYEELCQLCGKHNFPLMAKRLTSLLSNLQERESFKVNQDELFKLVRTTDKDKSLLE